MPKIIVDKNSIDIDRLPDICPICHYSVEPIYKFSSNSPREGLDEIIEVVAKCPRAKCSRLFIARYYRRNVRSNIFCLFDALPVIPIEPEFAEDIKALSPDFVKILAQSKTAEAYKLDQVCGVGYRKALEFLIKDYCISLFPARADEIKSKFLGTCIKEFVDDEKVRACAEFAAWLGNDETHYVRKWEDKDIEDLKTLIALTVNWIESSVLTKKYMDGMGIKSS